MFMVERNPPAFGPLLAEGSPQRFIEDLGRVTVKAGQYSSMTQAEGYASITVPFHNVGAGLALIHDAQVIGFDPGWPIHWHRRSMQSGVPPGQLTRISFDAEIDPGDGQVLEIELQGQGDETISFSVEVVYSDFGGGQRTRTRLAIEGRGSHWRITDVSLYDGDSSEPSVSLHREAAVTAATATQQPPTEGG
jgi:hypothetical protein